MLGRRSLDGVLDELRNDTGEQTITTIARSCRLTRAHFTRRFRVATGESPYAIAVRSRVERAKYLLTTPRRSISGAAYEAGFVDQSHLSTTFQRLVGVTPRQFRELHDRTARTIGSTILQDRG
jgi:AraC family transcriptional regulator